MFKIDTEDMFMNLVAIDSQKYLVGSSVERFFI